MVKVTPEHIAAREVAIRNAAITMFVRKGVEGATMQDIATEAGLSAGAIYRYYPGKEHLLQAVWNTCIADTEALFAEVAPHSGSPRERILAIGQAVWESLKQEDSAASVMLQLEATLAAARNRATLGGARQEMREAEFALMESLVQAAQDAGEIDTAVDPRSLAIMLIACADGLGIYRLELGERLDPDGVLDVLKEVLERLRPKEVAR